MRMRVYVAIGFFLTPITALPHHSAATWFDHESITEVEGELTELRWVNPHVRFTLISTDESGQETEWDIETLAVAGITRWGITHDLFAVGERLRVAGNPSIWTENSMFVRNILLPSGQEIQLGGGQPRWSERTLRGAESLSLEQGDSSDPSRGLFRVWSTGAGTPWLFREVVDPEAAYTRYPLTEAASNALAAHSVFEDNPLVDCTPKGMPTIMEQPYPIEFVREGEDIRLYIEQYDLVRTIRMGDDVSGGNQPASALGYSVGRWEGDEFIVTTTNSNWAYFNTLGIPLSQSAEMVERFILREGGARLDYLLIVTDPATFTEPVELEKHWIWRPEIDRQPYECTVQG